MEPIALGRRPALDGLRALSVLLVIAVHVGLIDRGYLAVDVFFALSGFLITALLYEERERNGKVSLRAFAERRARRLLPALVVLMIAFIALVLALESFSSPWPLKRLVLTTMTFINNWVATLAPAHGRVLGALAPTWTLGQEVQFYALWSIVLALLLRLRARPASVLLLVALVICGSLVAGSWLRAAVVNYNGYTSPLDRGGELLLGAGAAVLWRHRMVVTPLRWPVTGWLLTGGLVFVVVDAGLSRRLSYWLACALGALLIVNLLSVEDDARAAGAQGGRRNVLARALGCRGLCRLGRLSYGIYLFHVPVYYLVWHFAPGRTPLFYMAAVAAATYALAAVSWRLVEAPIIARRSRTRGSSPRARLRLRPALARSQGTV